MGTINYVVAAYFGPRRIEYAPQAADRMFFMRHHLQSLGRLKHRLHRITIVVHVDREGETYWQALGDEIARSGLSRLAVILHRPNNHGLSYSALASAIDASCEYTIFNEDDYVFTRDYFDEYLVAKLEQEREARDASLLCGCERPYGEQLESHAAVCTSIARTEHLIDLPRDYPVGSAPQVDWSRAMRKHGAIVDWLHDYATAYRLDDNGVRWIERTRAGQDQDPFSIFPVFRRAFLMPVQAIGVDGYVHFWDQDYTRRPARVELDGTITWRDR